jgi:SAM-dependent methyltransferase
MTVIENPVLDHHRAAAELWGSGGKAYDEVSFAISDALAHAAQRLNPEPGQKLLDVATGTGWTARNLARRGARVTGVDISEPLLEAARALSAEVAPRPVFELADAERLPFADASFDGVISTFGVMFAQNQEQAAAELARVCRPGGRLVVASWVPGGAVDQFFGLIAAHGDAPPPAASPLNWGEPAELERLLGAHFELAFERGENHAYHDDEEAVWAWYLRGFGPLKQMAAGLDEAGRAALRRDVDAYHAHYRRPMGLTIDREYLVVRGIRR